MERFKFKLETILMLLKQVKHETHCAPSTPRNTHYSVTERKGSNTELGDLQIHDG